MNDIFGRVFSIFLAVIVMFGMPLVYMQERAKTAEQLDLLTQVTHFVDSTCNTGYVSRRMMQEFYASLSQESSNYEIQIVHEQPDYVYDEEQDVYTRCETFHDEEDIWNCVEAGENYLFQRGDFLCVSVERTAGFLFFPGQDQTVSIRYGGTVKYEAF